jgi:hypothetical protein
VVELRLTLHRVKNVASFESLVPVFRDKSKIPIRWKKLGGRVVQVD